MDIACIGHYRRSTRWIKLPIDACFDLSTPFYNVWISAFKCSGSFATDNRERLLREIRRYNIIIHHM